jgi:hypothetical protein
VGGGPWFLSSRFLKKLQQQQPPTYTEETITGATNARKEGKIGLLRQERKNGPFFFYSAHSWRNVQGGRKKENVLADIYWKEKGGGERNGVQGNRLLCVT